MKINLEIIDAAYIFAEKSIEDLNTKELVPKMVLRRRLTRASKLVIELMSKINCDKGRVIFGTAYGELLSTARILDAIDSNFAVSPTEFQNSVYNTSVSYASILSNNKNETLTISSGDTTSLKILKVGAVKALDNDEILLVCSETLNIPNIKQVNKCIKYLESAVILKIKVSLNEATINLENIIEDNNFPKSIHHMLYIAKEFENNKSLILQMDM